MREAVTSLCLNQYCHGGGVHQGWAGFTLIADKAGGGGDGRTLFNRLFCGFKPELAPFSGTWVSNVHLMKYVIIETPSSYSMLWSAAWQCRNRNEGEPDERFVPNPYSRGGAWVLFVDLYLQKVLRGGGGAFLDSGKVMGAMEQYWATFISVEQRRGIGGRRTPDINPYLHPQHIPLPIYSLFF